VNGDGVARARATMRTMKRQRTSNAIAGEREGEGEGDFIVNEFYSRPRA